MKKFIIPGLLIIFAALIGAIYLASHSKKMAALKPISLVAPKSLSKTQESLSPTTAHAPGQIPSPPQASDQDNVIKEIRHELQAVMDLNKKINTVQQSKSAQLLRIQEQAQIHQKILSEIQKTTGSKQAATPSRETLLAQEKLRIIREETLRNKKLLEETARKPAA